MRTPNLRRHGLRLALAAGLAGLTAPLVAVAPALADDPDTTPPEIEGVPWDTPAFQTTVEYYFDTPASFLLNAHDPSGVTLSYEILNRGTLVGSGSGTHESGLSLLPLVAVEGDNWIIWRAVDGVGNSTPEQVLHVMIDLTAPTVLVHAPSGLDTGTAVFDQGDVVPLDVRCSDQFGSLCLLDDNSHLPATLPTDVPGEHDLRVHGNDIVGRTTYLTLHWTVLAAPTPPAGPAPAPPAGPAAPAAPASHTAADADIPTLALTGPEDSWPWLLVALALIGAGSAMVARAARGRRLAS